MLHYVVFTHFIVQNVWYWIRVAQTGQAHTKYRNMPPHLDFSRQHIYWKKIMYKSLLSHRFESKFRAYSIHPILVLSEHFHIKRCQIFAGKILGLWNNIINSVIFPFQNVLDCAKMCSVWCVCVLCVVHFLDYCSDLFCSAFSFYLWMQQSIRIRFYGFAFFPHIVARNTMWIRVQMFLRFVVVVVAAFSN